MTEYTVKFDLTNFFTEKNKFKTGVEMRFQDMQMVDLYTPWVKPLGYDNDIYTVNPLQGAFYAQDNITLSGMLLNFGVRLDYWAPGKYVDDVAADTSSALIISPGAASAVSGRHVLAVRPTVQGAAQPPSRHFPSDLRQPDALLFVRPFFEVAAAAVRVCQAQPDRGPLDAPGRQSEPQSRDHGGVRAGAPQPALGKRRPDRDRVLQGHLRLHHGKDGTAVSTPSAVRSTTRHT